MKFRWAILASMVVFTALAAAVYFAPGHRNGKSLPLTNTAAWQRMANPGQLVQAHAFLDHNCTACHTPVKGVEAINCIACHADETSLLQRQPTSFHADISSCKECHGDHRGRDAHISTMDHNAVSRIGIHQLDKSAVMNQEDALNLRKIRHWLENSGGTHESEFSHPRLTSRELTLNCAACHQNDDRHLGLFGNRCSDCHETAQWSIPEFIHPSSSSMDCAQCHEAPPSHYMEHFKMISQTVAGKPNARVDQCFECHQTTSWNDIIDVGWYKHH